MKHVPGWNALGVIDAHLRACMPDLPEGPPEAVLANALARLVHVGRSLMDAEGATEDQVAEELKGAVLAMARMLTGLRPQGA